jgi:hypothetical protein
MGVMGPQDIMAPSSDLLKGARLPPSIVATKTNNKIAVMEVRLLRSTMVTSSDPATEDGPRTESIFRVQALFEI